MPAPRAAARTFQDLVVWRKAHELVLAVYSFTAAFPKQETYGLTLQMRRAAVSIPANIAEGFRRRGKADKARYMNMAEASLEESRYYLILAKDLGYGDTSSLTNFTGRSQPLAQRLCVCHSGFGLLTPDFHIPQGYQGRSPCLVRRLVTSGRDCLHWGSGVRCSASDGFLLDHWPYHLALPRVGKTRWRRDGCGLRSRRP